MENSLLKTHVCLSMEWHPDKNEPLHPSQFTAHSSRKIYWRCSKYNTHEWTATIHNRAIRGQNCPYCSGQKVCTENSLNTLYRKIALEFNPLFNNGLSPDKITAYSAKKYTWQCFKETTHLWQASVRSRTQQHTGCPYCSNRKVWEGNSLSILYPEIAKEFDLLMNKGIEANQIVATSYKKYYWICSKNSEHTWRCAVVYRTLQNTGCPYCSNQKVCAENSLDVLYPKIAAELHPTKNNGISPRQIIAGSHKKYWWQCSSHSSHEWEAAVGTRTGPRKSGCPYCSNRKLWNGNSLLTLYPGIAAELHPTKNNGLIASQIMAGTDKKFWWQCHNNKAHIWKARLPNRTKLGNGCSECYLWSSSAVEIQIDCEINALFNQKTTNQTHCGKSGKSWKVDSFVKKLNLVIEYDSAYFHKGIKEYDRDIRKTSDLVANGFTVIRIRTAPLGILSPNDLIIKRRANTFSIMVGLIHNILDIFPEEIQLLEYISNGKMIAQKQAIAIILSKKTVKSR